MPAPSATMPAPSIQPAIVLLRSSIPNPRESPTARLKTRAPFRNRSRAPQAGRVPLEAERLYPRCAMENYPEPARRLVADMIAAAESQPARAVAFQGAPGANSHRALIEHFPDGLPYPCFSFEDALEAVKEGRAGQAIIPIENSVHGRVADIHFLLPESGLAIVGEHFLPIVPALIGRKGHAIREVMSHPQALGQSRKWLRARGIRPIDYADTAAAVAFVAEMKDWSIAAIAPAFAADIY